MNKNRTENYVDGEITEAKLDAALVAKVNGVGLSHTHTLSQVTDAGDSAGLDVGTVAGTVAAGDHAHATLAPLASPTFTGVLTSAEFVQTPKPVPPAGYVTFMFDDARETDYTLALPLFQSKGIVGVSSVIADNIGTAGYMTGAQIQAMSAAGWEVATHSKSHVDFDDAGGLTEAQMRAEFAAGKAAVEALGVPCESLVFPHNVSNALARRLAREYFHQARGGPAGANGRVLDTYRLAQYNVDDPGGTVNQKANLDIAAASGTWIICYGHAIDAADVANLGELIDYALSIGLVPVTLSGGVAACGNALDLGDGAAMGEKGFRGDGSQITGIPHLADAYVTFAPEQATAKSLEVLRPSDDGAVLTVDTTNSRVGIGYHAAAPLATLAVASEADGAVARIGRLGGTNNPGLWINTDDANKLVTLQSSGTSQPDFAVNVGAVEAIRILKTSGFVGVKTVAPLVPLHVYGAGITNGPSMVASANPSEGGAFGLGFQGYTVTNGSIKTGILHQRVGNNGRGDLVFVLNNVADATNATVSDEKLRIVGATGAVVAQSTVAGSGLIPTAAAPASQTAAGTLHEMRNDGTYLYVCTLGGAAGAAHWKRVALDDTAW